MKDSPGFLFSRPCAGAAEVLQSKEPSDKVHLHPFFAWMDGCRAMQERCTAPFRKRNPDPDSRTHVFLLHQREHEKDCAFLAILFHSFHNGMEADFRLRQPEDSGWIIPRLRLTSSFVAHLVSVMRQPSACRVHLHRQVQSEGRCSCAPSVTCIGFEMLTVLRLMADTRGYVQWAWKAFCDPELSFEWRLQLTPVCVRFFNRQEFTRLKTNLNRHLKYRKMTKNLNMVNRETTPKDDPKNTKSRRFSRGLDCSCR